MPNDVVLLAALLIPLAVLVVLRINAAQVFLSLCLGYVLVEFVAKDTDSLITFLAPDANSVSASTLKLVMLFTPAVLTSIIMLLSIRGRLRVGLNALPASAAAVLGFLLAVPLFTPGLRHAVESQAVWREAHAAQALIIGAGALVSLLFLWSQRRSARHGDGHGRHH